MGQLYVVQGESGLIKVGRTENFKSRIAALRRDFQKFGDKVVKTHCTEFIKCRYAGEWGLIFDLQKILPAYSGREWFASGDFKTVCELADKHTQTAKARPVTAAMPPVSKEQMKAAQQKRREARELALINRNNWREKRKQEVLQRKEIRATRQIEILARNAEKLGFKIVPIALPELATPAKAT